MSDAEPGSGHVRVHYGMCGSVPLQLFEFVFEPAGCYVLDCGAFTPLFGLAAGKHTRRARTLDRVYDEHGLAGLLATADTVTWLSGDAIERVAISGAGRFTRPKLTIETRGDTPSYSARLHDVDASVLHGALADLVGDVRVDDTTRTGLL
jgi:hypothetical protein